MLALAYMKATKPTKKPRKIFGKYRDDRHTARHYDLMSGTTNRLLTGEYFISVSLGCCSIDTQITMNR